MIFFLMACSQLVAQSNTTNTSSTAASNANDRYIPNRLVIKFATDSPLFREWKAAGRTGAIPAFTRLLGKHRTEPMVDDGLLMGVEKWTREHSEDAPDYFTSSLERICVIDIDVERPTSTPFNVLAAPRVLSASQLCLLAAKLTQIARRWGGVEYAELAYKQEVTDVPNDPLINSQTHLKQIQMFEAWDALRSFKRDSTPLIIGIVDSGVDYDHEDLSGVMYTNAGETGTDAQGRDKRSNGVDDDRNGKVDDWRGWDFVGTDGSKEDNDPRPGRDHGTHVAGIAGAAINNRIGVAGIAPFVRLLPVKASKDGGSDARTIYKGFQAMLYAATQGARIINCSWRVPGAAESDRELTATVVKMGAVVVSAAGNDFQYAPVYPGSYEGVLSVSSVTVDDEKSSFSNWHETVGIAAPGTNIYSTYPNNTYGFNSGTSMASPVVAGVAALVRMRFPSYSNEQVIAHLKATSDSIDQLNPDYAGRLGAGRMNALKAMQATDVRWMRLAGTSIATSQGDSVILAGSTAEVRFRIRNVLAALNGARMDVRVSVPQSSLQGGANLQISTRSFQLGSFAPLEERAIPTPLSISIPTTIAPNTLVTVLTEFFDSNGGRIGRDAVQFYANPSFRTIAFNNITTTLNSRGNLAFNDYPANVQGAGFRYKGSGNMLYEGALMVASAPDSVSNVARGESDGQDNSFVPTQTISLQASSGALLAQTAFADAGRTNDAGVRVAQSVVQSPFTPDVITTSYTITNTSQRDFTRLYAGLFMDWDIGDDIEQNEIFWDDAATLGVAQNRSETAPVLGMYVLTPHRVNFYALDATDTSSTGISLNTGFTRADKWRTLSSGIGRARSSVTDASAVIAAGPITLRRGETTTVSFLLAAAPTLDSLYAIVQNSKSRAAGKLVAYPQPASNLAFVEYELQQDPMPNQTVTIELVNLLGQVPSPPLVVNASKGRQIQALSLVGLPQGMYMVRLRTGSTVQTAPMLISQ
jgi:subtilisin family serine protease